MKLLILFALFAVACAQYGLPGLRYLPGVPGLGFYPRQPAVRYFHPAPIDEIYGASLGGAPVGIYDKRTGGYPYGFPRYGYGGRGHDVVSASLGGAKVGVYGKDHAK